MSDTQPPVDLFDEAGQPEGAAPASDLFDAPPAPPPAAPVTLRRFDDSATARQAIFNNVLAATQAIEPLENTRYRLSVHDVKYIDPDTFRKRDYKHAILSGKTLGRRMQGTLQLTDLQTQKPVVAKKMTLAVVPYLTDHGTYIYRGTEYGLANQLRLRSGAFARLKENGETETHINAIPGKGVTHRVFMEPATGVFKIRAQQAEFPLYPVLTALGVNDEDIKARWGNDIYAANRKKADPQVLLRAHEKLVRRPKAQDYDGKVKELLESLHNTELDPEVTQRTLGKPYNRLSAEVYADVSHKLLQLSRGEATPDDRDAMPYQVLMGPEDLFAERLKRARNSLRQLLFKATTKGNLDNVPVRPLDQEIHNTLLTSGLGSPLEEINPTELLDQQTRVTRLGEGGLPGVDSVPLESRAVQPTQVGFIDFMRTAECYDAETEVLTQTGWKRWAFVTYDDLLACLHENSVRYYRPHRLVRYTYTGTMYRTATGSLCVTAGHRMWVRAANAADFEIVLVEKLVDNNQPYYLCGATQFALAPLQQIQGVSEPVYCATVPGGLLYVRRYNEPAFWCGNSEKVGIDGRLAGAAMKGSDNRIYTPVRDLQTGQIVYKSAQDLADEAVAFPGETKRNTPQVDALFGGRVQTLAREKARYEFPNMEGTFSLLSNLVPFKSADKGQRAVMASRMSVTGDAWVLVRRLDGTAYHGPIADYTWRAGDLSPSIDKTTNQFCWKAVAAKLTHRNTKKLWRVTTDSGRSVTATVDHSFVTLSDAGRLCKIEPQAMTKHTPVPCGILLDCPETYTQPLQVAAGNKHNAHPPAALPLDFDTGWVVGLYLSEGYGPGTEPRQVCFANIAPEVQQRLQTAFAVHGVNATTSSGRADGVLDRTTVNWKQLYLTFANEFGDGAYNKKLPAWVLFSPAEFRRGVLAGYIAGDGIVAKPKARTVSVGGGSRSAALVQGLVALCGTLGIATTVRSNWVDTGPGGSRVQQYRFCVRKEFIARLPELTHKLKDRKIQQADWTGKRSADWLPVFSDLHAMILRRTSRRDKYRRRLGNRLRGNLTRRDILAIFGEDAAWATRGWSQSLVWWEHVATATPVDDQPEFVYDLDMADNVFMANGVFVHNTTQALPLTTQESPLLQMALPDNPDQSYQDLYGERLGAARAPFAGRVTKITPDEMELRDPVSGKRHTIDLYNNHIYNRKTLISQKPLVKVGDTVQPGQLLANSNFTDANGAAAYGLNLRTAYLPWKGYNFEDAVVVSSAAADKLTSEHAYQHVMEWPKDYKRGLSTYTNIFPSTYGKDVLRNMDDNGIVKVGTKLTEGHPLILSVKKKEANEATVHRGKGASHVDSTITWDHKDPGEVVDVFDDGKQTNVVVKMRSRMQVGDKLCFDEDTEVLTQAGWKPVAAVTWQDNVCTLQPGDRIAYLPPTALHSYPAGGRMYRIASQQVDQFVTANHRMYVCRRGSSQFELLPATAIAGKRVQYKKNGTWVGKSPEAFVIPGVTVKAGQFGRGSRKLADVRLSPTAFMTLLGAFISEGSVFGNAKDGNYGIQIATLIPANTAKLLAELAALGIKHIPTASGVVIYGKTLYSYFSTLGGRAGKKRLPPEIFEWHIDDLKTLFNWLMWGDGHCHDNGRPVCYTTVSPGLADDVQRLCLHIGYAANVVCDLPARVQVIKGKAYNCLPRYNVRVVTRKLMPAVNHSHTKTQHAQEEFFVEDYDRAVYCVTVPGHVLYVRRNGKACWSGNSGLHGDKGVISAIVPEHEMPTDEQGRPLEVLVNPYGLNTRTNAAQVAEAALQKIAAARGKPYKLKDFDDIDDIIGFAQAEMDKHGMKLEEDLTDQETGRKLPKVLSGVRYYMKLHHQAESKEQGRGLGAYSAEGTPAKGGFGGSKRIGMLETTSLLSHGVPNILRDAKFVRGQASPDYWAMYAAGYTPPTPTVPFTYQKFVNQLRGMGLNPVRENHKVHIMALTNKAVDELAGTRNLNNADTVNWNEQMTPKAGGLFDKEMTGSHGGNVWSAIKLHEPMPNPAFEEPIRRVLGLTSPQFTKILRGDEQLHGDSGPAAIYNALDKIDLDLAIKDARQDIDSGKKTKRDAAIRRLKFLTGAQRSGIHPRDWVLNRVPVLPPAFRPVSVMGPKKLPMVADPNYLYKELWDANENLKQAQGVFSQVGDEREALYNAFRGVTGLGDPVQLKNQQRGVKGILQHVLGNSPKTSVVQRQLLGSQVDMVGRAVITPDPELDMDEIGLPENSAWELYGLRAIRALARRGMSKVEAARAVEERSSAARQALLAELDAGPIIYNRAPTLHKYGFMAAYPKLTAGHTLSVSPLVVGPYAADFDGNCCVFNTKIPVEFDLAAIYTSSGAYFTALEEVIMRTTGSTKLPTQGMLQTVLRIGEIPQLGTPIETTLGQQVFALPAGFRVLTYDPVSGGSRYAAATHLTVDNNHPCVLVETARGRKVEVSDNESLCCYDTVNGQVIKITPRNAVGMFSPFVKQERIDGTEFNRDIGWWYGALVADGWLAPRTVGYAKNDDSKRAAFERIARSQLNPNFSANQYDESDSDAKFSDSKKVHLNGVQLRQTVFNCYADRDDTTEGKRSALLKKIPDELLQRGNRECLLGVLAGLLEGDRSIGWNTAKSKPQFFAKLCTSSTHLIDSAYVLLRKLGVRWSLTTTPARGQSNESFTLSLSSVDLCRLAPELQFVGADAQTRFAELQQTPPTKDDRDVVPVPADLAGYLATLLTARHPAYSLLRKATKGVGRITRAAAAGLLLAAEAKNAAHPQLAAWRLIVADTLIHWDEIRTVSPIAAQTVYDLAVPDTKVFAVNNGLVIYDTMQFHLPGEQSQREAAEKMLPSKNLLAAADFKSPLYKPTHEYVGGLYEASVQRDKLRPPAEFATVKDAIAAYRRGEIDASRVVHILRDE